MQISPLDLSVSTVLLGFILFEVSLVDGFLHKNLSDFFDLIVVDDHHLAIKTDAVEVHFCIYSVVWYLEAHESKGVSTLGSVQLDALNFTILRKDLIDIDLIPIVREVLDVQVASFLGVLVSQGVFLLLKFTIGLLQGMSDVELVVAKFSVVKGLDSF